MCGSQVHVWRDSGPFDYYGRVGMEAVNKVYVYPVMVGQGAVHGDPLTGINHPLADP